jgi:hypothetical protein
VQSKEHPMRMRTLLVIPAVLIAALAVTLVAGSDDSVQKPQQAQPAAAQPQAAPATAAPAAAAPIVLDKPESAKWTPTTLEAATTEAQKKVLDSGKPATVTGEVVDVSCYLQLGKRGEAHVACGSKCIANGQPIGLLDDEDHLYILMPEEHHPRRDGQVEIKTVFAPLLAKKVTVSGMATEMHGYRALFVPAVELGGMMKSTKGATK